MTTEVTFRVVDLECLGLDPPDPPHGGIIEVGSVDITARFSDDNRFVEAQIDEKPVSLLYKPVTPIGAGSRAVHHISNEMVAECPPCTETAVRLLLSEPKPLALVAHNSSYEQSFLTALGPEVKWICTYKVALRLFPEWESHSNHAVRYALGVDLPEAKWSPPHRAGPDAMVTAWSFVEFLKRAPVRQMLEWTRLPKLMLTCPIGKDWRGKAWSDLEADALRWIVGKGADMDSDVLYWAKFELERRATLAADPTLSGDYA